jgi:hypothetical protein
MMPGLPAEPVTPPKTKPLHWQPIPQNRIAKSIFSQTDHALLSETLGNVETTLEKEFGLEPIANPIKDLEEKRNARGEITVLDIQRAQNIEIRLSHMKIDVINIVNALLRFDDTVLTEIVADALLGCCATEEEAQAWEAFDENDAEKLSVPDKLSYLLWRIPRSREKLMCIAFKHKYKTAVQAIEKDIQLFIKACEELCTNARFAGILEYILHVGNIMNRGRPGKSNAKGFRLPSLAVLRNTKTADGSSNLLRFLIQLIEDHDRDLLRFKDEFPNLEPAMKLSIDALKADLLALENKLKTCDEEDKMLSNKSASDILDIPGIVASERDFSRGLKQFMPDARDAVGTLRKLMGELDHVFNVTQLAYGERIGDCKPEDLFSIVREFIREWEQERGVLKRIRTSELKKKMRDAKSAATAVNAMKKDSAEMDDVIVEDAAMVSIPDDKGKAHKRPRSGDDNV